MKYHFIGDKGISMSGIKKYLSSKGHIVTGSDIKTGGHSASNITSDIDLIVRTIAVPDENPEVVKAKELKISVISYPEMLGIVSKDKYTIAVSGTHGKTTTTAMIAKILKDNDLDPTVIVGSMLKEEKSNFIAGNGPYLVVESCEYRRSFLNIHPRMIVITNIDEDHLDYFKDLRDIQSAFTEFTEKLGREDYLIADVLDKNVRSVVSDTNAKLIDYSSYRDMSFEILAFGDHNKSNAGAAIAVAHALGILPKKAAESLKDFKGTWRRQELKGETKTGAIIYDDYAHHPTEIKATLNALRKKYPTEKITVAFQPHLYSRTKDHIKEFAGAFVNANKILLAPIYAAREKDDGTISSQILREEMSKHSEDVVAFNSLLELQSYASETLAKGDIFVTMGAGNIYEVGEELIKN